MAQLPSGVVTFLLTDVVGSTRLWDTHSAAMSEALDLHDGALAAAVHRRGGVLLKSKGEGDSTFSVFARATDAALAALDISAALESVNWPPDCTLTVRIALHTGEAVERGGDYYGTTVNRVARLRGLAEAGEILVSQATAEVIADHLPPGAELLLTGERDLRDLARPELVYVLSGPSAELGTAPDVSSRRNVEATAPSTPVPPPRSIVSSSTFVGRKDELAALGESVEAFLGGGKRAVLLAGEPGIGKSRLAAELALMASASGASVLHGRCDSGVSQPYQPFVEALTAYAAHVSPQQLAADAGAGAADLARLVPAFSETAVSRGVVAVTGDPEVERAASFDAVVAVLCAAAKHHPLVMVLDDLHWANAPTVLLLRHVLRAALDVPLMVVGTYRDTDLTRGHPLTELLAEIRRDGLAQRLSLGGLGEGDVADCLEALGGHGLDERCERLAAAIHAETRGNAFFMGELLRHLVETGVISEVDGRLTAGVEVDDLPLPEGVREVVSTRLSRLSDESNAALTVGAVVGMSFSLAVVEAVVGADVIDALDEAVDAGILGEAQGGYVFTHALIQQTVLADLSAARRMRLHRRIGEALEAGRADPEAIAFHYAEAALDGKAGAAADWAIVAAEAANRRLAFEESYAHLQRGLAALDLSVDPEQRRRAEVLIAMSQIGGARIERRRQSAYEAAQIAEQLGDAALLARAAVVYGWWLSPGLRDGRIGDLTTRALRALGDGDSLLRSALLASYSRYVVAIDGRAQEAVALADEALAVARPGETLLRCAVLSWPGRVRGSHSSRSSHGYRSLRKRTRWPRRGEE